MKCTVIGMWGGFPKRNGPCSGYLIQQDSFSLLMDCGSGVLTELQNYIDLNDINHVVLSHYHYDHSSDIGAYMFSRLVNTRLTRANEPLTIYGPSDETIKRQVDEVAYSEFIPFDENSKFEIGPFRLTFKKNVHPVETYSIKIECESKSLVFTADSSYTEDLVDFAMDTDLLITESSLYKGMNGSASGHMNAQEAGILAYKSNAKKVLLTHLPHYGELEELLKSAKSEGNQAIELARVGMVIEV